MESLSLHSLVTINRLVYLGFCEYHPDGGSTSGGSPLLWRSCRRAAALEGRRPPTHLLSAGRLPPWLVGGRLPLPPLRLSHPLPSIRGFPEH